MRKLIGAILIVLSSVMYGVSLTKKRRARTEYLTKTARDLERFKSLIAISKIPVGEALEKCTLSPENAPNDKDKAMFEEFKKGLDAETGEGIIGVADLFLADVLREKDIAREKFEKEAHLIKSGSVLMGLLAAIILL